MRETRTAKGKASSTLNLEKSFWGVLIIFFVLEIWLLADLPKEINEQQVESRVKALELSVPFPSSSSFPLVVLFHPIDEQNNNELWNTGVWPSWGEAEGNMRKKVVYQPLRWAAEGIYVQKTCDVDCYVTHDQYLLPDADVVVMEVVNHQKFLGTLLSDRLQILPKKSDHQLWGIFHFEPEEWYPDITNPSILSLFDLTITPKHESTIPVTLVCDWGYGAGKYLEAPPQKKLFIADLNYNYPYANHSYLSSLHQSIQIDTYHIQEWKNQKTFSVSNLPFMINFISQYKFILITESLIADDWVAPEWSQALIAGVVPIYLGAPNIDDFVPGEKSYINMNDYSVEELVTLLNYLNNNDDEYRKYFAWKQHGLSTKFQEKLSQCAHYAECRICHYAIDQLHNKDKNINSA